MYYWYIVIFIILLFIFIIFLNYRTEKNNENYDTIKWNMNVPCICVFDIDNTITCSLDHARAAIEECKANNCKISLNTARTSKYYKDVNLHGLGLSQEDFENDHYTGTHDKLGVSMSYDGLVHHIANTKVSHLNTINNKYGTPRDKIILFDDNYTNIEYAKNHGFSVIHANNPSCGLPFETRSLIKKILF